MAGVLVRPSNQEPLVGAPYIIDGFDENSVHCLDPNGHGPFVFDPKSLDKVQLFVDPDLGSLHERNLKTKKAKVLCKELPADIKLPQGTPEQLLRNPRGYCNDILSFLKSLVLKRLLCY
jgi:hypothetical protein